MKSRVFVLAIECLLALVVFSRGLTIAQDEPTDRSNDAEIRRLNEELRSTQRKLDQAVRAGFLPVEEGIASAQEIIKSLPKDLELSASKKLDEFQFEKVKAFIQNTVVGKLSGGNRRVAKVEVEPLPGAAKDPAKPKYTIEILFSIEEFPTQGIVINQQVYHLHPLTIRGDEEIAEIARRINIGKSYELRGVISEVDIKSIPGKPNRIDVRSHLAKVQFEPFN